MSKATPVKGELQKGPWLDQTSSAKAKTRDTYILLFGEKCVVRCDFSR